MSATPSTMRDLGTALPAFYTFPYLRDETQDVAQAFHAACTPDLFLFDASPCLAYRGQFDASWPRAASPVPVTGQDLVAAAEATTDRDGRFHLVQLTGFRTQTPLWDWATSLSSL